MKKFSSFMIAFALVFSACGWTVTSNTVLTEEVESGTPWVLKISIANTSEISITSVTTVGDSTELDFSGPISDADGNEYSVVSIGGFADKTMITKVTLPSSLRTLTIDAFRSCTSLATVTPLLPESITFIGWRAFAGCTSLTGDVVFPANEISTSYSWQGGSNHGWFGSTAITSCDMSKAAITEIAEYSFQNCKSLKWVKLPQGIQSIPYYCFSGATALTNVTPFLPDTITKIAKSAFYNCSSLAQDLKLCSNEEITFTSDWQGSWAFRDSAITSVEMTAPQKMLGAHYNLTINGNIFQYMKNCGEIILPKELEEIYEGSWYGCTSLTNLIFNGDMPTLFTASSFDATTTRKIRMFIPRFNSTWDTLLANANFTPMNETLQAQYLAVYPEETVMPLGSWLVANRQVWVSDIYPWVQDKAVYVQGDTCEADLSEGGVSPSYGIFENFENGDTQTFTAPAEAEFDGGTYRCKGYVLRYEETPGSRVYSAPVTNNSTSCTITQSGDRIWHLVWLWEPSGYQLDVNFNDESAGSVTFSPENSGSYEPGSTVTISAAANAGNRFIRWFGDVPEGQEREVSISILMDAPKSITAVFSTPWTYNPTTKQITDGNWVLGVKTSTLVENGLSISSLVSVEDPMVLDLGQSVSDPDTWNSYTIVEIATENFSGTALRFLYLGDSIQKIGTRAFYNCTSLESVYPLLPASLIRLGQSAFGMCTALTGDVVFPANEIDVATTWSNTPYGWFYATKITSCDMSAATISTIVAQTFNKCEELKEVKLPKGLTAINASAFQDATALTNVVPFLPETVTYIGFCCFNGCKALESDLVLSGEEMVCISYYNNSSAVSSFGGCKMLKKAKILAPVADARSSSTLEYCTPVYMFNGCTGLETVEFHESITNVSGNTFYGCTALKDVTFYGSVPGFASTAFNNVSNKKVRFHVSKGDETWQAFRSENVTRMDETLIEEWEGVYPGEKQPWGQFTLSSKKMWFYQDFGFAGMLILVK